jgi:uncharacterized protein with PQ loop repeat
MFLKFPKRVKKFISLDNLGYVGLIAGIITISSSLFQTIGYFFIKTKRVYEWSLAIGYIVFAVAITAIVYREIRLRSLKENECNKKEADLNIAQEREKGITRERDVLLDSVSNFHNVFHNIRDAHLILPDQGEFSKESNQLFRTILSKSLDALSNYFTAIYNIPCFTCIKLITDDKDYLKTKDLNFELSTLIRDSNSRQRNRETIGDRYHVFANTSFRSVIVEKKRYFYESNLPQLYREGHYANQSHEWGKDYKCTAVVPIRGEVSTEEGPIVPRCCGFLCVDANKVDAFPEQPTIYTLACVADIMYITLKQYRRLIGEKESQK